MKFALKYPAPPYHPPLPPRVCVEWLLSREYMVSIILPSLSLRLGKSLYKKTVVIIAKFHWDLTTDENRQLNP